MNIHVYYQGEVISIYPEVAQKHKLKEGDKLLTKEAADEVIASNFSHMDSLISESLLKDALRFKNPYKPPS